MLDSIGLCDCVGQLHRVVSDAHGCQPHNQKSISMMLCTMACKLVVQELCA